MVAMVLVASRSVPGRSCHLLGRSRCLALAVGGIALACVGTGCMSSPQRRYAYVANDATSEALAVLERREVQDALELTREQREQVTGLGSAPLSPAMLALVNETKGDWHSAGSGNAQDGNALQAERSAKLSRLSDAFWQTTLDEIRAVLSEGQFRRYLQVSLQVYGPSMLLRFGQVAADIGLEPAQLAELRRVARHWDGQVEPLRRALGRYAVCGYTQLPSPAGGTDASAAEVVAQIESANRGRDEALLEVLTREQRRAWKRALGKPVRFVWDTASVYEVPGY